MEVELDAYMYILRDIKILLYYAIHGVNRYIIYVYTLVTILFISVCRYMFKWIKFFHV